MKTFRRNAFTGLLKKINKSEINISADIAPADKEMIVQELATIERDPSNTRRLALTKKAKVKEDIGRSPDFRDMLLMRKFFDYNQLGSGGFKVVR